MTEAAVGNWDSDFSDNQNGEGDKGEKGKQGNNSFPKTEYMKMEPPGTYKIRLVGQFVKFRKHFRPYRATVQDSERDIDPAWQAGFWPQQRYAINVIDRADGKIKVLEKPHSLFKLFYAYRDATKIDPTKNDGPDWSITVKIPKDKSGKIPLDKDGNPDKLKTEYTAMPLDKTPFTPEELKKIFKVDEKGEFIKGEDGKRVSNLWPLRTIYKSTSAEVMQKMWNELPADRKIAPKKKAKDGAEKTETPTPEEAGGAEPAEESMTGAPAENNDMFEKEGKEAPKTAEGKSEELF